jgi:hypothetical protein
MATVINLSKPTAVTQPIDVSDRFKTILEKRQKGKAEPLTPEKLRRRPGLENITDEEALIAIDTIKRLAAIFFETACHIEASCIDNQHIVNLKHEKTAA